MPICARDRPARVHPGAAQANRRGLRLRAQGDLTGAVDAFREGIAAQHDVPELHANLGFALAELSRIDEARSAFESALALDETNVDVRWGLYELEQIAGNAAAALAHQRAILDRQTLFTHRAADPRRCVVVFLAPGDWQANVPVDFLLDAQTTSVHKLYVLSRSQLEGAPLPADGVMFNAIAQSSQNDRALDLLSAFLRQTGKACLNDPDNVRRADRVGTYRALGDLPRTIVPETIRVPAGALKEELRKMRPLVVRPVDSQAGRGLELLEDGDALTGYLERTGASQFYVMPFVDFRSDDGMYRKYRVIVVDGVPYPYHLAISPKWMIHYYNAPMRDHAWMREEEARFLRDFESVFPTELRQSLTLAAHALDLEYFGVDCAIDREGRLVIFEADPAMLVHAADDPRIFGYKRAAAQRIFAAFADLLDRARSG